MNEHGAVADILCFLGGLAIFIFAIKHTTSCLRAATGQTVRTLIFNATRHRRSGVSLGTFFGFLMHSGPTVVILLGFLQAGLIRLEQAVPVIVGANIGTSLSMQIVSFKIGAFFFLPIVIGVMLIVGIPRRPWEQIGGACIGFGLLFLGMDLISRAVTPHRALIEPWLAAGHQANFAGQFAALGVSALATVAMQSSGATLGILFALCGTGMFKELAPVLPLILGAHIGTCSTALLASAGMSAEARRGAVAHLLFNVVGSVAALLLGPLLVQAIRLTNPELIRQAANMHTAVMLLGSGLVVPLQSAFVRLVRLIVRTRAVEPPSSFLDDQMIERPEHALYQAIRELQRVARISWESFRLNAEIMFKLNRKKLLVVRKNEDAIDEIQRAMKRYLQAVSARYLSRRQSILLQHLNRCMIDIERIGDHNDNLADLAERRHNTRGAVFPSDAQATLFELFQSADKVLQLVIQSLNPEQTDFQMTAHIILQARDTYADLSMNAKGFFSDKVANHEYAPIVGIFLSEYVSAFDRIVRHAKNIALAESQPYFWIKRRKLERVVPEVPRPPDNGSEPRDFLDKLQSEGFV